MLDNTIVSMLWQGTLETLYMTLFATLFSYLLGLPLGMILILTDKKGMHPMPWLNGMLNVMVNLLRSVPFLILLVAIIPFTRAIVGSFMGSTATIVPLVVAAAPFVARLVEQSLQEVDGGVVEAAQSMGASPGRILWKVMLPEAKPSMIVGSAIACTTILGYSAMAGFTGGGGLGDIAIKFGFYRYETAIMWTTVLLLVIVVQILQEIGMRIAKSGDKRNIGK